MPSYLKLKFIFQHGRGLEFLKSKTMSLGFSMVLVCLFVGDAFAGVEQFVLPPSRRQEVLKVGSQYLTHDETEFLNAIQSLQTPFLFPDDLSTISLASSQKKPVYSDLDVIKAIAYNIKPQGVMIKGDERALFIGQGKIGLEDTFHALVQGVSYNVTLTGLSSQSFTLKMNNTSWTQHFDTPNPKNIHFDQPGGH